MKSRAKMLWNQMSPEQKRVAAVYYCNLQYQVHHNCEHGGTDFASRITPELKRAFLVGYAVGKGIVK